MSEPFNAGDGHGKVRMLEVAEAAGVSRSTVSNVMRGLSSVGDEVRLRVLEYADRLGYVYDRGAASLRLRRSNLVGLVIPDIANPFIAQAVRGAHETLVAKGYLVVTIETGEDPGQLSHVLRSLAEHRVDGFLVLPAVGSEPQTLRSALGGLPVVVLNRDIGAEGLDYVGPDEEAVAAAGAAHLVLDHSCSSVAYFGGPSGAGPRKARVEAFERFAAREGARIVPAWNTPSEATASAAYRLASELISSAELPQGIQCHSDSVAYGLLRALREAGVTPEGCRVIGCDDLPESEYWNPGLTSVSVDAAIIGRTAAQLLLRQITGDGQAGEVPEPHLVVRESCGCTGTVRHRR